MIARTLLLLLLASSTLNAQSTVLLWAPSPNAVSVGRIPLTAFSSAQRVDFYAGTKKICSSSALPVVGTVPPAVAVLIAGASQFGCWWTPLKAQTVTIWAYACASKMTCAGASFIGVSGSPWVHVAPAPAPTETLRPVPSSRYQPPAGGFSPLEP